MNEGFHIYVIYKASKPLHESKVVFLLSKHTCIKHCKVYDIIDVVLPPPNTQPENREPNPQERTALLNSQASREVTKMRHSSTSLLKIFSRCKTENPLF